MSEEIFVYHPTKPTIMGKANENGEIEYFAVVSMTGKSRDEWMGEMNERVDLSSLAQTESSPGGDRPHTTTGEETGVSSPPPQSLKIKSTKGMSTSLLKYCVCRYNLTEKKVGDLVPVEELELFPADFLDRLSSAATEIGAIGKESDIAKKS